MDNKKNIKIFVSVLIILVLGVVVAFIVQSKSSSGPAAPGKYDAFAACLKTQGASFYGAFWCPHCKAQKEEFDGTSAVAALPYVECSTPDGQSQDATCNAKDIESYPTWEFTNPLTLTENTAPIICTKAPGMPNESAECAQSRSQYGTMWIFPDSEVESTTAPTQKGNVWTFVPGSQLRGVQPLATLAAQTGCALPQ